MPRPPAPPLAQAVRRGLSKAADPARAPAMQAYMKSEMAFLGVGSPERRALVRAALAAHPPADADDWQAAVLCLWDSARFREERYAAIDLLLHPRCRAWLTFARLPLLEKLITEGAWWDYVDGLASHGMGSLLRAEPAKTKRALRRWSRSRDLWKRRTSLLAQLRSGADVDLELLYACIEDNLDHDDFFVQKAIGWALRQHAWTDPEEVRRHVAKLGERLSPLARREALKNIGKHP
ncbi:MAG: DNA alkylation repair protein [Myxococcales bacterium]|nr:DNA alkylation repair protein [Myxococcales bacterium]